MSSLLFKNRRVLPILALLALVPAVSGCIAQREEKGYVRTTADFDKILPGMSTNKDVLEILGSPSSYSSYGDETWYYISSRRETKAFLKPKIIDQSATAIVFDKEGKVKRVDQYADKDRKEVAVAKEVTPTEGNQITVWQQLLGNLGKFNTEGGMPGQHSGTGGAANPNR